MTHSNAYVNGPQLEGTEGQLLQVREAAAGRGIASLDELRRRAEAVLAVEIADDPQDPIAFAYHSQDWCRGYRVAFLDLLRELDKGARRVQ